MACVADVLVSYINIVKHRVDIIQRNVFITQSYMYIHMVAHIDPKKAMYCPESLAECQNVPTVPVGGVRFASYTDWPPRIVECRQLVVSPGTACETTVSIDGFQRGMSYHNEADAIHDTEYTEPTKILAKDSLELAMNTITGGGETNLQARWNLTIRDPTIADKITMGIALSDNEEAIAKKYDLHDMHEMGTLPKHTNLLGNDVVNLFDEVVEIAKRLPTVAAGGELVIGGVKNVPIHTSKVFVLLGIAFDTAALRTTAGIGLDDTFIKVDRDAMTEYMVLDAATMPGFVSTDAFHLDDTVRMFMPALEKFSVRITTTTGFTAGNGLRLRYIYGIRKLSIIDHIKWRYPFRTNADTTRAEELDAKHDITERVAAGVLGVI